MRRLSFLFTLTTSFIACNMGDSSEELPGDYFYVNEGGADKVILSHSGARDNIYGEVIDYKYNDEFIIATQRPDTEVYAHFIASDMPGDDIEKNLQEVKNNMRSDPYYSKVFSGKLNYWIISHHHNKAFGPLTKSEFEKLHDSLNIDEDLSFD